MSKNLMIGVLVIVALVGGVYLYQTNNAKMMDSKKAMEEKETSMVNEDIKPSDIMMTKDDLKPIDAMMIKSKRYVPYSKEALDSAESTRRILFFYANWCPTCIPTNADFEKNVAMIPKDVTVIRVNYNDPDTDAEEKALATKYGITYQHTFVQIDKDGKVVTKWNGGMTSDLLEKIK